MVYTPPSSIKIILNSKSGVHSCTMTCGRHASADFAHAKNVIAEVANHKIHQPALDLLVHVAPATSTLSMELVSIPSASQGPCNGH